MIDKLLIFDLTGKFACWKKFYSNSSSFTYEIPSRTAIIGILASILEKSRDSYYETFSTENCNISLSVESKLKKKFYCMNYFKKPNERNYTQVRLEVLTPQNIQEEVIRYRIYISLTDKNLFEDLINRVKHKQFGFGIYLGQRQFRGDIEFVDLIENDNLRIVENIKEINSITNLDNLENKEDLENSDYIIETMPIDFKFCGKNEELNTNILNREIEKTGRIIFTTNFNKLKVKSFFKKALEIKYKDNKENICFY
jgi:CRISPR-associated protein Cas5h